MIKNEREYRITQTKAAEFERSLKDIQISPNPSLHPKLLKAQRDALEGQLEDLRAEIADYEALRSGKKKVLELSSLEELPRALIEARISAGLTQRELAERLKISEQQIQRYEATDYSSASLSRLQEIVRALGLNIRKEVFLPSTEVSSAALEKRLLDSGIARDFLSRRITGEDINQEGDASVLRSAGILSRMFGWKVTEIFTGATPLPLPASAMGMQFKLPANAAEEKTAFFSAYVRFAAELALKATPVQKQKTIPRSASDFRKEVMSSQGRIDLTSTLNYLWNSGIPVLPIQESGGFHAACWRIAGRNAIALKQTTTSTSRWLHDLLHETYHAAGAVDEFDFAFIEQGLSPYDRRDSEEEIEATQFAADVLLGSRAEELVDECVREAKGSIPNLKTALPRVAQRNDVPIDALANYMAWRLSQQNLNWWGTATNLQSKDQNPWRETHEFLIRRLDWNQLDRTERELLMRAISET
ncbi:helix-turn-helix domain-containing protein [Corallococcus macrosporus]|uniref:Helix-turn-helix domain-containing protein n=1 Tax=Corallococcus macrosporus TaxID=35 RepID=A0ABS3D6E7_9BACT|nr:helix-turn-helix domain-containing protein [Corallococcus macrosporus]MBN8227238.1 helix-turn-helix domain-containing protein [Corallococcus macrosporus]